MIERNWRGRLSRYGDVAVSVEPNANGNCFHTELKVGRVVMTISAVETPSEIVREAIFRKSLAEVSQLEMFKERTPPPDDALLYAIVLHGPLGGGLLSSPSFLHVGFPARECDHYADRFDLLDQFPVLQSEITTQPATEIQKKPRLRRKDVEKAAE